VARTRPTALPGARFSGTWKTYDTRRAVLRDVEDVGRPDEGRHFVVVVENVEDDRRDARMRHGAAVAHRQQERVGLSRTSYLRSVPSAGRKRELFPVGHVVSRRVGLSRTCNFRLVTWRKLFPVLLLLVGR